MSDSADTLRGSLAHIDDTDTDEPDHTERTERTECTEHTQRARTELERADKQRLSEVAADDSDYYTPDDSHAPVETHEVVNVVGECAPQRWALPHHVTSLPGTPLSQASVRSSGDSYSSTSSTRQLLAGAPLAADTPC